MKLIIQRKRTKCFRKIQRNQIGEEVGRRKGRGRPFHSRQLKEAGSLGGSETISGHRINSGKIGRANKRKKKRMENQSMGSWKRNEEFRKGFRAMRRRSTEESAILQTSWFIGIRTRERGNVGAPGRKKWKKKRTPNIPQ